ncbi:MAG TPA: VOC family protein [Ignavibacteria bacterium]|nr:VOC family protein [Ignavibacteria bacterium]HMR39601.1 VOC family protein [Ignavibacteria bacterium]
MNLIPENTKIQSTDLRVRDLNASVYFYSDLIGFKIIDKNDTEAILSSSGELPYLIRLTEDRSAPVRMKGSTGLYHMAFLFPDRKELARVFMRLFKNNIKFQGFSDHLVSEAVYLSDPDGNGVELYADKPKNQWQESHGQIIMDTLPLDLSIITNELDDPDVWEGVHPDTTLGHIHLNVSDIRKAEEFYNEIIGFRITNTQFPKALFLGAGGYHHHIGANTWMLDRRAKADESSLGLISYTISIPDKNYANSVYERAEENNMKVDSDENGISVKDHDNIKIRIIS